METAFTYHSNTFIGGRSENQDSVWVGNTRFGLAGIVCDGMGGGKGGKRASNVAIEVISEDLLGSNSEDPVNALYNSIQKANFEIFRLGHNDADLEGMGTTVAIVLISEDRAYVAHVGDSRIYQIRSGKIIHRSSDHSVVFRMLKDGILTSEEQARNHPQANQITRALGLHPVVDVEVHQLNYEKGDCFFLCSDGINGELSDSDILSVIDKEKTPVSIVEKSIKLADSRGRSRGGGHDNATSIFIQCNLAPVVSSVRSGSLPVSEETRSISYATLMRITGFLALMLLLSLLGMYRMNGTIKNHQNSINSAQDSLVKSMSQLDSLNRVIKSFSNSRSPGTTDVQSSPTTDDSTEVNLNPSGDENIRIPVDSIEN